MTTRKISQRYKKRLSLLGPLGPLILCVMGIVACALIDPLQEDLHVKTIGEIPSGLIPLSVGWPLGDVGLVLPTAMSACLIGYMESIAIGKNLAAKNGYTIEAGQELLALGMANLVSSEPNDGRPDPIVWSDNVLADVTDITLPYALVHKPAEVRPCGYSYQLRDSASGISGGQKAL
eukprot:6281868-Amphidinium_carterae.1